MTSTAALSTATAEPQDDHVVEDRARLVEDRVRLERDEGAVPSCKPVEVLARVAYASCAFGATYLTAKGILHLDAHGAGEVALLNGGVAYYTHEAAGKVVAALNRVVYRASRKAGSR
jgi:hypothetical protein